MTRVKSAVTLRLHSGKNVIRWRDIWSFSQVQRRQIGDNKALALDKTELGRHKRDWWQQSIEVNLKPFRCLPSLSFRTSTWSLPFSCQTHTEGRMSTFIVFDQIESLFLAWPFFYFLSLIQLVSLSVFSCALKRGGGGFLCPTLVYLFPLRSWFLLPSNYNIGNVP